MMDSSENSLLDMDLSSVGEPVANNGNFSYQEIFRWHLKMHGYSFPDDVGPMTDSTVLKYLQCYFVQHENLKYHFMNQSAVTNNISQNNAVNNQVQTPNNATRTKRYKTPEYFKRSTGAHATLIVSSFFIS